MSVKCFNLRWHERREAQAESAEAAEVYAVLSQAVHQLHHPGREYLNLALERARRRRQRRPENLQRRAFGELRPGWRDRRQGRSAQLPDAAQSRLRRAHQTPRRHERLDRITCRRTARSAFSPPLAYGQVEQNAANPTTQTISCESLQPTAPNSARGLM